MFKKLVIALMLLAAPFAQAKAVLACAMMQDQIIEQCCLDEDCRQACATSQDAARGECCCVLAIDTNGNIAFGAAAESVVKKPVKKLWDSSPDLATAPPPASMTSVSDTYHASLPFESHIQDSSRLYLLTARLRL